MTVDEFLLTGPCLEEITGFLQGLPGYNVSYTEAEIAKINARKEALMRGQIVPASTKMTREFTYRIGSRPVPVGGLSRKRGRV